MTDDLITFLNARLDELATAAAAASDGPWTAWRGQPGLGLRNLEYAVTLPGQGEGSPVSIATASWMDAEHIALNDPARRLRDIALKRAILAEHASSGGMYPTCMRCARWEPGTWYGDEEGGEEPPDDMSSVSYPCRTVRQLGTEFSDHPDYRQEWKP